MPAPPPQGRGPTPEEVEALIGALANIRCCRFVAAAFLPPLRDPAVCERLGGGGIYRLVAACSWGFGAEALAIMSAGLAMARACSKTAVAAEICETCCTH